MSTIYPKYKIYFPLKKFDSIVTDAQNFYLLKIHLKLFEISNKILIFEHLT